MQELSATEVNVHMLNCFNLGRWCKQRLLNTGSQY